jgi:short subunit dehydrogenase-like uncharacterized protein
VLGSAPVGGHLTPSQLVGRDFVEHLPGSGAIRIEDRGAG